MKPMCCTKHWHMIRQTVWNGGWEYKNSLG
jgi:hypothetical protein